MKIYYSVLTGVMIMLLSISSSFAQKKIYFCSDYTSTGEPIATGNVWNISSEGGNVYMLYKNDGVNISTGLIWVFIDKLTDGDYKAFSTTSIVPYKFMNWALYDFKFKEAGEYKVRFIDAAYQNLAIDYVTIKFKDESNNSSGGAGGSVASGGSSDKVAIDYYNGSVLTFCERVDNGKPVTPSTVFNISSAGGYVYVFLDAVKAFKSTQLIVDVWEGEVDYKNFVETVRYDVTPTWTWTDFKYTFKKPGLYKFMVYNKEEVHVQTGYVTINSK